MSKIWRVYKFGKELAEITAYSSGFPIKLEIDKKEPFVHYYLKLTTLESSCPELEDLINLDKDLNNFDKFEQFIQSLTKKLETIDDRLHHYILVIWGLNFLFLASRKIAQLEGVAIKKICYRAYRHAFENSPQIGYSIPEYNEFQFLNIKPRVLKRKSKYWEKGITKLIVKRDSLLFFTVFGIVQRTIKNNFISKIYRKIVRFFFLR